MIFRLILPLVLVSLVVCQSRADVISLRSGGTVSGNVEEVVRNDSKSYLVDVGNGVRVSIAASDVVRLERQDDKVKEYEQKVEATPDEAEAHWQLARWCKINGLTSQADRHVRRTINLDPDHGSARAKLGFVKKEGKWVNHARLMRSRGLVLHQGQWKTQADADAVDAAKQQEILAKQWLNKIKMLRSRARKRTKAGVEALAELKAINDPMASPAIGELLKDKDPLAMRMLWVDLLCQWETPAATNALILASVSDPDPTIAERCIDRLNEVGRFQAVSFYIGMLKNQNNQIVKKGGQALASLPDTRATFALIDALITQHKVKKGGGNNTNTRFDQTGGFTFGGGKEEIVKIDVQNTQVRSALMTLAGEGVDYGFDEEAWRRFFAEKYSDFSYDMRRES